jgi:hypothetical protein
LLLSAIAFFCCSALPVDLPSASVNSPVPVIVAKNSVEVQPVAKEHAALPEAPAAKSDVSANSKESSSASENMMPGAQPFVNAPAKPAIQGSYETERQRKIWYGLIAASHGAAVFDTWSTRRAVSSGYGTESDPFLRPFAHSDSLYVATQVSPAVMDYLGHRMMTSDHLILRRMWWLPQAAGASFSLGAGIHNYHLVP